MGKIDETISLLKEIGLPRAQQNDRSAITLLALLDLNEKDKWSKARKNTVRIHDILIFAKDRYDRHYAENSRETIRRQTIHQFEQAGLAVKNPDNPKRPTNSPNTVYTVSDEALATIKKYKSSQWKKALSGFTKNKGKLIELYAKRRKKYRISVKLPDGEKINFSPGKHNELQKQIIEDFRRRFCPKTTVLYVGDTARKMLHLDKATLKKLSIPITEHGKLPDVVLYDEGNNVLFLIEAVTAHEPLSPKRQIELEKTLGECKAKRIYISAFPDFREFKKHMENVAWDTEVWIRSNPDHMVHFNGPKFFTLYEKQ
ncbi:restriction endonuclease [bacterium]|nr:restriction endonuclease [bacterium]